MSVRTSTYVLYGLVLPYQDFYDTPEQEALAEEYSDDRYGDTWPDTPILITDGMGSEYIAIGVCTYRTDIDMPVEGPISISKDDEWEEASSCLIHEACEKLGVPYDPEALGWHVIGHYG